MMRTKQVIDLGPEGRDGIEAKYWDVEEEGIVIRYVWVNATDHPNDWKRHFQVGVGTVEVEAARLIAQIVTEGLFKGFSGVLRVGGHSWGGSVAEVAAALLRDRFFRVECTVFGGKRPIWPFDGAVRYRHRGDFVPWLPPWRPRTKQIVFGSWEPVWRAHRQDRYQDVLGGFSS